MEAAAAAFDAVNATDAAIRLAKGSKIVIPLSPRRKFKLGLSLVKEGLNMIHQEMAIHSEDDVTRMLKSCGSALREIDYLGTAKFPETYTLNYWRISSKFVEDAVAARENVRSKTAEARLKVLNGSTKAAETKSADEQMIAQGVFDHLEVALEGVDEEDGDWDKTAATRAYIIQLAERLKAEDLQPSTPSATRLG